MRRGPTAGWSAWAIAKQACGALALLALALPAAALSPALPTYPRQATEQDLQQLSQLACAQPQGTHLDDAALWSNWPAREDAPDADRRDWRAHVTCSPHQEADGFSWRHSWSCAWEADAWRCKPWGGRLDFLRAQQAVSLSFNADLYRPEQVQAVAADLFGVRAGAQRPAKTTGLPASVAGACSLSRSSFSSVFSGQRLEMLVLSCGKQQFSLRERCQAGRCRYGVESKL